MLKVGGLSRWSKKHPGSCPLWFCGPGSNLPQCVVRTVATHTCLHIQVAQSPRRPRYLVGGIWLLGISNLWEWHQIVQLLSFMSKQNIGSHPKQKSSYDLIWSLKGEVNQPSPAQGSQQLHVKATIINLARRGECGPSLPRASSPNDISFLLSKDYQICIWKNSYPGDSDSCIRDWRAARPDSQTSVFPGAQGLLHF